MTVARGLFPDLESPFLDEEVLPAPTPPAESRDLFEERPDAGEAAALDEAGETEGAAGSTDPEFDEGEQSIDEAEQSISEVEQAIGKAEQAIDDAEQAIDEGAAELEDALDEIREVAETGGHVFEDFEGIEDLEDTEADEHSELDETYDPEAEQPDESREEPDEESLGDEGLLEEGPDEPQASGGGGTSTATPAVTILLDEPLESDDKYQLVSKDKTYSKTLGARDARPLVDGAKRLTFSGVDAKKEYQLVQIRSKGSKRVILPMILYRGLTEAGHQAPKAKYSYLTVPSQAPRKLPDRYRADQPVDSILAAASPVLVIAAKGTRPIRQIDIIRDNKLIHSRTPMEREVSFRYKDTAPVAKDSYFYVRVIQVDDQMAWSSPVWVSKQ